MAGVGEIGNAVLVGIIAVLTAAFVVSAVSGVAKGIQWLSNTNMVLAISLAFFLFVVGPTIFILNMIPTAVGSYLGDLPMMSARTGAEGAETNEWLQSWTVFYWAWWISWTPFVGMFIARISRGRTIRQFVTGVLLVPSLVSLIWFAVFGGTAINLQKAGTDIFGAGGQESQLFTTLEQYPLATLTGVVVMILVAIFFVSGADAASIVMGTLSERGTTDPRRRTVVFWGAATGAVAAVMLLIGTDALNGLKTITIVAALPFVVVMVALAVSLVKDLRKDPLMVRHAYAADAVEQAVITGVTEHGDDFVISVEQDPEAGKPTLGLTASYQLVASGRPSWNPAADWTPTTARSWSSSRVAAPAYVQAERTPEQISSIRSSTPGPERVEVHPRGGDALLVEALLRPVVRRLGGRPVGDRAGRRHPEGDLVGASVEVLHQVARRLVGAGEPGADHHR